MKKIKIENKTPVVVTIFVEKGDRTSSAKLNPEQWVKVRIPSETVKYIYLKPESESIFPQYIFLDETACNKMFILTVSGENLVVTES